MNFFDLHCDTPYKCFFETCDFYKNSLAVSGGKGSLFQKWKQVFAVWINDDTENPFELYKLVMANFKEKIKEKPKNLTPYFAVEGGAVIGKNLDLLHILKQDGISFFTPTWNGENYIAGGVNTDTGLTDFGVQVIKELNYLNIACDLSHLNEKSFYRVCEISEKVVATHSNCQSICKNKRNLTDSQLKLIKEKNGLVGLCFYPLFLGEDVKISIYRNIYHLLNLGMENNIAIGSDFDGADMDKELDNLEKIPVLYAFLESKGLENKLLDKIFYENANKFTETFDKGL